MTIKVWKKAARSNDSGDACVELGAAAEIIAIRDSKDPDGPRIIMSRDKFRQFANTVKNL